MKATKPKPGDAYRNWFWRNGVFNLMGYFFYRETNVIPPGYEAPANYGLSPTDRQTRYDAWLYQRYGR